MLLLQLVARCVLTVLLTQTPRLKAAVIGRAKISGYDGLMSLFGPNSNSNCSGAVDMDMLAKITLNLADMKHRIVLSHQQVHRRQPDPVRYVNNGAGTTGTTGLFRKICDRFNISGFHYETFCSSPDVTSIKPMITTWYMELLRCRHKGEESACGRNSAIELYPEALHVAMATGGTLFADTPAAEAFADILRLNPRISVMTTYRNPDVWAARRKHGHSSSMICHPDLWDEPGVLHPFDFISCLKSVKSDSLFGALEEVGNIDTKLLAQAYIKMSTVNAYLVLMNGRPYLPICLFDHEFDPIWAVVETFRELKHFNTRGRGAEHRF